MRTDHELKYDFDRRVVGRPAAGESVLPRRSDAGFKFLPISVEHALRAGRLKGAHRDPWDRMIAAQALSLDIPVISNDELLDLFGVRRVW